MLVHAPWTRLHRTGERHGPLPALGVSSVKWQGSGGRSVKQSQESLTEAQAKPCPQHARGRGNAVAKRTHAVAYLRTSSAVNLGADWDSDKRKRDAITAFANRAGFVIADEFYDPAMSGADPIETRSGPL